MDLASLSSKMQSMMTVEQALAYWVDKKQLTKKKAMELVAALPAGIAQVEAKADSANRAIGIFSAVGGILLGLGVILFVASNWQQMTPVVKILILLAGMLTTGAGGYWLTFERHDYQRTGLALLFVNILVFGASIFLVGQVYHLPLTYWWGALLWFMGALVFAFILQSRLHLWLSVPLLILFLGWLRSSISGSAGEFNFLFDDTHSILTMGPVIGAGLVSAGILLQRTPFIQFGRSTLMHWGLFLLCLVLVVSTTEKQVFFFFLRYAVDPLNIGITLVALAFMITAVTVGTFQTPQGRWGLLALGIYTAFVYLLAYAPVFRGIPVEQVLFYSTAYPDTTTIDTSMLSLLFYLHVVLVFIFSLVIVWEGTLLRMPTFVNIGMLTTAFVIIIQYFSWAIRSSLDRSIIFIIGGFIILGVSAILERQRRKMITSMHLS